MFNNQEFELDLISYCLKKPLYLRQHKNRLSKLKFSEKYVDIIYKQIFKCLDKYSTVPTESELKTIAVDFMKANDKFGAYDIDIVTNLISNIYSRQVTDMTGITVSHYLVEEEARRVADVLTNTKGDVLSSQLTDLERNIAKLRHLYCDGDDLGTNLFSEEGIEEARQLLEDYHNASCLPTGFPLLDEQLQGGLRKGELCVILAQTGLGKTASLLNLAKNYVTQGYRVAYIVLDNIKGEIISRTLGCMMNQDITTGIDPTIAMNNFSNMFLDKYRNKFFYKHYAPRELTKSILERYLDRLKLYLFDKDKEAGVPLEDCGKIDVLVIDYMDLMLAESGAGEFWISAEHLAQEIKAVLKNYDILGLTATQGGTEAMKAETVKLYMAQGAKSKFNAPDVVFALSQTDSEKAAKPSIIRWGCLKARRAKVNYQIKMRFHREKQLIEEDPDVHTVLSMTGQNIDQAGATVTATNDYANMFSQMWTKAADGILSANGFNSQGDPF